MLIPKSVFNVSSVCGTEKTKYTFDAVKLERDENGNAVAITSDGSRILVAKWDDLKEKEDYFTASEGLAKVEENKNFNTLIPIKPWDEICKAIPKKPKQTTANQPSTDILERALVSETEVGKTIPLETRDYDGTVRRVAPKPAEGNFPNWKESVPAYELLEPDMNGNTAVRIRLSSEALAELIKTIWTTAGKTNDAIDLIVPTNPLRPVEIRSNHDEGVKVTGFMFPINSADIKTPFPGALDSKKLPQVNEAVKV